MALLRRTPWSVVLITLALLGVGLLGIARSEQLIDSDGRYLRRQSVWIALSLLAMVAVCWPNYRRLLRWSYWALAAVLVLLVAVYFFSPVNGSRRWIRLGPLSLQPSEFAKVALVVALGRYLMFRQNYRRLLGLAAPMAIALVPSVLILREPDLGTATVFPPVVLVMLFAAGARRRDLAVVLCLGLLSVPVLWTQMSREQRSRVTALFQQTAPGERPTADGYHLHQAKEMLALGGVWGSANTGEALEDLSAYHVPEPATDSIFVVLGERYGLVGVASLLLLYVLLAWRGLVIAERTREPFGRLVAAGVVSLLVVEVLINTGMMVGLLPITGLSAPLVSYGGSGLLAHTIAIGLLVNVGMRPGYEVSNEPFRFVEAG